MKNRRKVAVHRRDIWIIVSVQSAMGAGGRLPEFSEIILSMTLITMKLAVGFRCDL
jgi:hypothetical protein